MLPIIIWQKLLLAPERSLSDAVEVLNLNESMRIYRSIALIVDQNNHLLGTVTDGDVRRGLMKGYSLNSGVREIMNTNPTTVTVKDGRKEALRLMREKDLWHIPVVDNNGKVVGLEVMREKHF